MKNIITTVSLFILSINFYAQTSVNIDFTYKLSNFSYCDFDEFYIEKKTNKIENELLSIKKQYEGNGFFQNDTNKIQILSAMHFDWNSQKQTIVYYKEMKDGLASYRFFYTDMTYKDILENVQNILVLKNDFFWQFYNNIDDPQYSEINKLKSLVRDSDNVLNIFRLSAMVKSGKIPSKYLEK